MKIKIILFLLLLTSCHPLFCSWQNGYDEVNHEPTEEKIIGIYELNENSKSYLNEDNKIWPLKIEILKNKQCIFHYENNKISLVDKIFASKTDLKETKKNKIGKWYLYFDKEDKNCIFEIEGISTEPLYEKDGKLAIIKTIGDGDECNGIVYEKQN